MITNLHAKINRISNGKSLIFLLALSLLLMVGINTINLPISVPRINELSHGVSILDLKTYYTSTEANQVIETLNPQGRSAYLKELIVFDFIFPFIYSLCLAVIVTVIFRKAFKQTSGFQKLFFIPFFAGMFDWLENISIITMLINYPTHVDISYIAGYFTLGKWIFTWFSLFLIVLGLIRIFLVKLRSKG